MYFIEINNLEKVFLSEFLRKPIKVLDDITFSVPEGATFGVLGPNGAGKTTTMKIILGLLKPTSGTVKIMGEKSTTRISRARIGYMPENPYFYSYLTGREFLEFCAELYGLKGKLKKEKVEELLELVGMTARADRRLGKSSKGMLQRIGIAQALLNDPDFILLDEPMSGLDPLGRKEIRDIILSLKNKNKTIFFNSHILSDVEELCDSIAILKNGRLVACDSLENIKNKENYPSLEEYFIDRIKNESGEKVEEGYTIEIKG